MRNCKTGTHQSQFNGGQQYQRRFGNTLAKSTSILL